MKIIVLAGGYSPERDVSLSSGSLIANALMERGHEVFFLDPWLGIKAGERVHYRTREEGLGFAYEIGGEAPDLELLGAETGAKKSLIGPGVLEACREADMVFIALHGSTGENGQIQAVLEAYGIPHTGSGYMGSLLAMDKNISKILMRAAGVATPDWYLAERGKCSQPEILPCVVKPLDCGSSVGVTIVDKEEEWHTALEAAFSYGDRVLVEKKITGREFSVGVLGGRALPAIEIIPEKGFYDYKNKYQPGMTREICPAGIDEKQESRLEAAALTVHRILELGYYSRVDFLMDGDGAIYCLEANTLPGMTPFSLLPQEAEAAGITYQELCEAIVKNGKGAAL